MSQPADIILTAGLEIGEPENAAEKRNLLKVNEFRRDLCTRVHFL